MRSVPVKKRLDEVKVLTSALEAGEEIDKKRLLRVLKSYQDYFLVFGYGVLGDKKMNAPTRLRAFKVLAQRRRDAKTTTPAFTS